MRMRMKTRRRNRQRINNGNNVVTTIISPNNNNNNTKKKIFLMICTTTVIVVVIGCFYIIGYDGTIILSTGTINFNEQQQSSSSSTSTASTSSSSSSLRNNDNGMSTSSLIQLDYEVSHECKQLPFIRPMGSYFLSNDIQAAASPEGVEPSFNIGSNFGTKVTYHMGGDKPHFQLIKELLSSSSKSKSNNGDGESGGLVLDMGANQGFFTWYLATLGMDVHAFEIFDKNVIALQHGAEFNPPDVGARVHIYPVGLGQSTGRMGMGGSDYEGHLRKTTTTGPILSSSIDCFVYHNLKHIGNDLLNNIAFVKLDVEGYEIDVLLGGSKSIFGPNNIKNIGGMLMEVGPKRWDRGSNITFQRGVETMKDLLSNKFDTSYIIIRTNGRHAKTCPPTFASHLQDQNPRILDGVQIHEVTYDEWEPLLQILYDNNGDCNFWYTNN